MKKIIFIFISILLLAGCTTVDFKNSKVDETIKTIIEKDVDLYNNIFDGYKFYIPRGMKILNKTNNNIKIMSNKDTYYLYVDLVSYYYNVKKTFEPSTTNYLSKELRFNDELGYIDITEINNKYFIEFMYNYAKIEAYVDKDNLNQSVMNMAYILSSIQYNRKVIETLIGENSLDYKEEKYDIFKSERENSTFVEYAEKYYNYDDKKDIDQDILDFDVIE